MAQEEGGGLNPVRARQLLAVEEVREQGGGTGQVACRRVH